MAAQQRIATLTVNPAVDLSTQVLRVVPDRKLRCAAPLREPGGGGINVARAIYKLGGEATACFPAAGASGELLVELLAAEGVASKVVSVGGSTRENLNVVETMTGQQYRFCMPGPELTAPQSTALLSEIVGLAPELAVLSGSLAPGMLADFYARATTALRELGARVVVDTSGDALHACANRGVFMIKASAREFASLIGESHVDRKHAGDLAARAVARGVCDVLVVSLGADGAVWATKTEQCLLTAPAIAVRSTVGAGDSMVAAIVLALARGQSLRDAMRQGVAAGSAAVMQSGTGLCRREDVEQLVPAIAENRLAA